MSKPQLKYSHILAIYPYIHELKNYNFFPPIGLEHIAAAASKFGEMVTVLDRRLEKEIDSFIQMADLFLICINWPHEQEEIKAWIRNLPPSVKTIVGGRHATEYVDDYLKDCHNIDAIIRGDGEEIIREVLLKNSFEKIKGVSYRKENQIIHNQNPELSPISETVYPDRRLRRYDYQVNLNGFKLGFKADAVSASRGCPFSCTYCDFDANPLGQKRNWSARSPESIVKELKDVSAEYVIFTDDIFTFDQKRVIKICDLILEQGILKKFIINTRINIASNEKLLSKMYAAGFRFLLIGIESTQDRTLKSMQKGFTTRKVLEWGKKLSQFNFFIHGYFIIGNIGETEQEMLQISSFAHATGVDTLGLSTLQARKFSPLIPFLKDWPDYKLDERGKVYSDKYSTEDLRNIRRKVTRAFYLEKNQIIRLLKKIFILKFISFSVFLRLVIAGLRNYIKRANKKRCQMKI